MKFKRLQLDAVAFPYKILKKKLVVNAFFPNKIVLEIDNLKKWS